MKKNVMIDLASGWRQLSEEERRAFGAFADDEKIRMIAIATGSWGAYVPNLVVTDEDVLVEEDDEHIFADSAQSLVDLFPGFLLIDDFEWPLAPANARLRTGVYILDDLSLTVLQLVWLADGTHEENDESRHVLWTATCTCPSTVFATIIDNFMEMVPTLEVAS
jgi:hypothetical protein